MTQALERSQSEGTALRAYIQYKLAPIVFEQVAALEMLLSAVEHFRSQMSSKVQNFLLSGNAHSPPVRYRDTIIALTDI